MQNETIEPRSQRFAKILTQGNRQVLVFMRRTNRDSLAVVVQAWADAADHQLCAALTFDSDDRAEVAFDSITDETIGEFIVESGMSEHL